MTDDEVRMICEARQLAHQNGMFVVQKNGKYLLYRKCPVRNVPLGARADLRDFRRFVNRVAGTDLPRSLLGGSRESRNTH